MPQFFTLDRRGGTALVTLARPPANAMNLAVLSELLELITALCKDETRAVVLTGQGRFFSAGLDLYEVFSYEAAQGAEFTRVFDEVFSGLFALELPVVAAINGHAVAGGAVLAATADFRLSAEGESQLGLSEIKVGVPFPTSAFEIVRTAWRGPHFSELVYRGKNFKPKEALSAHLIDAVVPASELVERAVELANELGSRPKVAFSRSKRALRKEALSRIAAARVDGQDPVWTEWRTPEVLAAMVAYRAQVGGGGKKA